ncbi:ATP-binding response regulator [Paenibacillus swuensis]|uniref:ATP-binding response regulator n=1 Tax=Paenibacillus swuensis TaxID=1178515 RepID=UPI0009EF2B92|nr:response regulator [Paenibacillus swuensis]
MYIKTFLANVSIMLTILYLASLVYKYMVFRLTPKQKEVLFIALAIGIGWVTMQYGFRFSETVIFDLRYLAIIVAPMFVRSPWSIPVIGLGIGLARLSFGINLAAFVGFANVIVMSLLCAALTLWARRRKWSFYQTMLSVIFWINTLNVLFIATFGIIPANRYLLQIAPITYLLSLSLSLVFMLVLKDFIKEAKRQEQLQLTNETLQVLYRDSEEKTEKLQIATKELEESNRQIVRASRYKSEFLANMSHELRTPLNSMLVLSQMLEENADERLSEEEVRYAGLIYTSGKDLLRLIDDILDLSKIEAGHMTLQLENCNISELCLHMEQFYRPVAELKKIALRVQVESDVPKMINTDPQRLQQILMNLLSNAIKFTGDGIVLLTVYKLSDGTGNSGRNPQSGHWLVFSVQDTGIGIPEEEQELVFHSFYQADGTTSRKYGGTGLGLSISKQFAVLMGGFMDVESREGLGSRFSLYLPWDSILTEDSEVGRVSSELSPEFPATRIISKIGTGAAPAVASSQVSLTEAIRVLLVDDDPNNNYALGAALGQKGIQVLSAPSGKDAIRLLEEVTGIDAVLMDIMMPGMDGLETIRRIRSNPRFEHLPIIAVTAKALDQDREDGLAAGATDYMKKPIDVKELLKKLQQLK